MSKLMLFGAAAVAFAAVVWFAVKDDSVPTPPDRDPDNPGGPVLSTTEGGTSIHDGSTVPVDVRTEEIVRDFLKKVKALFRKNVDALGEAAAGEFTRDEAVVRALAAIAVGDGDAEDRAAALMVLGWARFPVAQAVLSSALNGDYGPEFITTALWSLGNAEPNWAVPLLREMAVRGSDLFHQVTALQALLLQESQGALDAYADALDRASEDPTRRLAIYKILGGQHPDVSGEEPDVIRHHRLGMPNPFDGPLEIPPEFGAAVDQFFARAAAERDPRVSRAAALAAMKIKGERSNQALGELWANGDDGLRQSVLIVVNPGDPEGHFPEILRRLPSTKDREARDTASLLLGDVHDPGFLSNLRTWRDAEGNADIRSRIEKTIRRLESQ